MPEGEAHPRHSSPPSPHRPPPSPLKVGDGRSTISRAHCQIRKLPGGGQLAVADKSTNGIFVNGTRVREAALEPGDELVLGTGRDVPVSDTPTPTSTHTPAITPMPTAHQVYLAHQTSTATAKSSSSNPATRGRRHGRGGWWCATPPPPPAPATTPPAPPAAARARPAPLSPRSRGLWCPA